MNGFFGGPSPGCGSFWTLIIKTAVPRVKTDAVSVVHMYAVKSRTTVYWSCWVAHPKLFRSFEEFLHPLSLIFGGYCVKSVETGATFQSVVRSY